jgi:hypothetical protein
MKWGELAHRDKREFHPAINQAAPAPQLTQPMTLHNLFITMPRVTPLCSVALAAFLAVAEASAQTALPKDSPFLPTPGTAANGGASTQEGLELAGVSSTAKNTFGCIYDNQTKRSHWIPVNATVEGIKVLAYDSTLDQVSLSVGGQNKVLRLRKATVSGVANANPGAAAAGFATPAVMPITQGSPQPPPAPGSIAQQETEARMLVSDLLEIGIQQRKAYEDAQKKTEAEKAPAKKD